MNCGRPGCGEKESRINGYCSVYCEDIHELQLRIDRLKEALAEIVQRERRSDYASIFTCPGEFATIAREALRDAG